MVIESKNFREYHELLSKVLRKYHGVAPVHSASELELLASRFPDNIKLYAAEIENELLAGAIVFENGETIHTQYLANSDAGRKAGALDCVIYTLLTEVYKDRRYFDFGISNEQDGKYLNVGLITQKQGFGARAVVHDFYKLDI